MILLTLPFLTALKLPDNLNAFSAKLNLKCLFDDMILVFFSKKKMFVCLCNTPKTNVFGNFSTILKMIVGYMLHI